MATVGMRKVTLPGPHPNNTEANMIDICRLVEEASDGSMPCTMFWNTEKIANSTVAGGAVIAKDLLH